MIGVVSAGNQSNYSGASIGFEPLSSFRLAKLPS